jgi:hypothetical protein
MSEPFRGWEGTRRLHSLSFPVALERAEPRPAVSQRHSMLPKRIIDKISAIERSSITVLCERRLETGDRAF